MNLLTCTFSKIGSLIHFLWALNNILKEIFPFSKHIAWSTSIFFFWRRDIEKRNASISILEKSNIATSKLSTHTHTTSRTLPPTVACWRGKVEKTVAQSGQLTQRETNVKSISFSCNNTRNGFSSKTKIVV